MRDLEEKKTIRKELKLRPSFVTMIKDHQKKMARKTWDYPFDFVSFLEVAAHEKIDRENAKETKTE